MRDGERRASMRTDDDDLRVGDPTELGVAPRFLSRIVPMLRLSSSRWRARRELMRVGDPSAAAADALLFGAVLSVGGGLLLTASLCLLSELSVGPSSLASAARLLLFWRVRSACATTRPRRKWLSILTASKASFKAPVDAGSTVTINWAHMINHIDWQRNDIMPLCSLHNVPPANAAPRRRTSPSEMKRTADRRA
jgi:hypothetical protein